MKFIQSGFLVLLCSALSASFAGEVSAGQPLPEEQIKTTLVSYPEDQKFFIPQNHPYHQTLVMKLFMCQVSFDGKLKRKDNGKSEVFLNCEQALDVIRRMDNLTLGIPKIVYLVGWQYNGHDSKYPAWFEGNDRLKRPQDANALESLKWLMKESEAFHTTVSLHINMFDAYEDSPLWDEYVGKDIIAKNADGSLRPCEWGYPISYAREWETGCTQKRIDALCELLPIQHAGTIHIDAFHTWPPVPGIDEHGKYYVEKAKGVISPYLNFTVADETEAQRNVFRYWAQKGVDVTSESVDFLRETAFEGYQAMAWWFNRGGERYYLKWPAAYYCGGRDNTEWGMLFGTSMHGEDIVRKDRENLRGFKEQFCLNTAVWYYLNRLRRLQVLDGKEYKSVVFSDNVRTELTRGEGRVWRNALYRISRGDVTLVENTDVLIPALWMGTGHLLAYSKDGYENRSWTLPEDWKDVKEAKLFRITAEGKTKPEIIKPVAGKLVLTLARDEMILISGSFIAGTVLLDPQLSPAAGEPEVKLLDAPPTMPIAHYSANRPPLAPSALVRLPMGAVKPAGWLKQQLVLQAAGFHGHLMEISSFLKKDNNSWLSPTGTGERGWEEVPYWLKGYLGCAILTQDPKMLAEAKRWIEGAIGSRQPDGWFGPDKGRTGVATNLKGRDDLWPNMVMLFCLQEWFEHTGDARVPDLMTQYFRYLNALPEDKLLLGYWPSMRGGDQLYSILWLYNRTGEAWLLELAHKTHRRTARWDTITETPRKQLPNWHNVNIAQAFREPTTYWMLSNQPAERDGSLRVWSKIRELYGQVPGGMFGADENARPDHTGPRQAIETCGIAEEMLSDGILISVTGDPLWAERCEDVAFNTFPAAFTADWKALRYLTAPNQPQSDHATKSPAVQNGGPMFEMNPHRHRCCQHNAAHGWPYFTQHLWFAAPGNGLAAYLYGPCEVTAKVAGGTEVRITEKTRYPFEEQVSLTIHLPQATRFPLDLRVPSWCAAAKISINGEPSPLPDQASGKVVRLERDWQDGDQVVLELPMTVRTQRWTNNRNTASVSRGPLTYSLQIKEEYRRSGGTDAWPAWDIFPASPWNFGITSDAPAAFTVVKRAWPADDQPFRNEAAPIQLTTKARKIPNWTLDARGAVNEVVPQPVKSTEPEESVTLIPMGAARLRISAFPVIDNSPDAMDWPADPW